MVHDPIELSLNNPLDQPGPAVRAELIFRPQSFGGRTCYVAEDPVSGRFFRIGLDEYTFISLLDGKTTVRDALDATRAARPDCRFTPTEAAAICQWLARSGLVHDAFPAGQTPRAPDLTRATRRTGGRWGPLTIQLPLFHPDRFFQRLEPRLGWCFSFPMLVVWVLVLGWALRELLTHGDRLTHASTGILSPGNWIWLGLAWLVLKVFHECGHALVCKRLGGEVREAGLIFILFAPLAYVDVTSSWRLQSKWARIQVAAAGMYVELFLAAIATLVWSRADPGPLSQTCFNIMTTASVMTILFNANPLMRFDGYYILSDFLELPNLYMLGQQYVSYLGRRYLLGMPAVPPNADGWRRWFLRGYGLASLVWRNLVFFGLVLTAATLFQGAGIVLSLIALGMWGISMLRRSIGLFRATGSARPHWPRFIIVAGGAAAVATLVLATVPWPGAITSPAIVRYAPRTVVRTESDGFVRAVHVRAGQRVEAGQTLVQLENDELKHQLAELELQLRASRIKIRVHKRKREMAQSQAEEEMLRTLREQCDQKRLEVQGLTVRAPRAGNIIGRRLVMLQGIYLTKGSELLSIGDEQAKELRVAIAQQDIDAFRHCLGNVVRAYLPGSIVLRSKLDRIEPRASLVPIDISLCATDGGSLAVRPVDKESDNHAPGDYELLSPRFTGVMPLDPAQSTKVHAGQRARVALKPHESIGHHCYRLLMHWVDKRLNRGHRRQLARR